MQFTFSHDQALRMSAPWVDRVVVFARTLPSQPLTLPSIPAKSHFYSDFVGRSSQPKTKVQPMTASTMPTTPASPSTMTLVAQIEARQAELGITDKQVCDALGYEKEVVFKMIKLGNIKLPLTRVPALAAVLSLDSGQLLKTAMTETSPELLAVIESVFNPINLTATETNLIRHLRKLAGDQPCSPIVFEGKAIIALVTA